MGALLGTGPDLVARFGLDAAFPAFFLALLVDEFTSRRAVGVAVVSAVVTPALLAVVPPGVAVLGGSAVALVGLAAGARRG